MEQSTKDLWIQKLKQGKALVIQSALAPLKKDCLWFKNGALYVYGNRGWEDLGIGDGGDEPTPLDPKYVPTPIVFDEFEQTVIIMSGNSFPGCLSEQITIPNTAQEFQDNSYADVNFGEISDTVQFDSNSFVTEDSPLFENLQQILESIMGENAELVFAQILNEAMVIMATDVSGQRKIFALILGTDIIPEGAQITINSPEPQPEPEPEPEPDPEPEPSDRVYVPVPTELAPFESVTYEYEDPFVPRGTEKAETRDAAIGMATISYVTVPDNAAGFEVTENLCLPIYGTYESASEAKSTTPFGLYPYWEAGLTPEELTSDSYYDHIVGIMTSLYGPDEYEILHYDRFWDADRHFEAHTWTAKVREAAGRVVVEKTKLFVTVGLSFDVVTIEDASIQIREPIA